MDRVVLHCDANKYYASVEILDNPALRPYPVAVCGCQEDRHGIVLTANAIAKKYGIQTGMANWEAKKAAWDGCVGVLQVGGRVWGGFGNNDLRVIAIIELI